MNIEQHIEKEAKKSQSAWFHKDEVKKIVRDIIIQINKGRVLHDKKPTKI